LKGLEGEIWFKNKIMQNKENLTPWMIQYYEIKEQYKDCILFFRMWDFYEMFDEDANIAHRVLWIAVTSRNKNASNPIPLAWIPYHAKEKYLPQLVKAGYKVAIAEQVSDPKAKWIVKREVQRVVTPSTLSLEWENYEDTWVIQNLILAISQEKERYWISFLDLATNKWTTWEFRDFEKLKWELYKLSPKEVILDKSLFTNTEIKDVLTKKYSLNIFFFEVNKKAKNILLNHFWVVNLEWFNLENRELAIKSSALLLEYLKENQKSEFEFLNKISFDSFSDYMDIDESTIKNLDLIYNFSTKSSTIWTLFWVLNKTKTAAWTRFLREQIIKPLQDIQEIEKRQDMIEEFLENPVLLDKVQWHLKYVSDIDTILNRLALNRALPRDLLNLKRSLQSIVSVLEIIREIGSKKLNKILEI
jgi:DNA mismatch repair protein MutS